MPAAIPLAIAAGTAAGGIGAAVINSKATTKSAELQTNATNTATAAESKANEETLAFQKQQAADDAARFEAAQRGNYNQYVNRSHAAQALGDTIGFHLPDPAEYVPSTQGATPPTGPGTTGTGSTQRWTPEFVKQQLAATGQDPSDQNVQYFLGKENELKARETQLNQPGYALWRLRDPNSGKSGASMSGTSPTIASYLPSMPSSPAFAMAPAPNTRPFQLRTINAFLR